MDSALTTTSSVKVAKGILRMLKPIKNMDKSNLIFEEGLIQLITDSTNPKTFIRPYVAKSTIESALSNICIIRIQIQIFNL